MTDIEKFISSPREREMAVRLLLLFRERMEETDQTLEMLIYKSAPELGPLVKRMDIYHWFTGRSGISPTKYPAVKAFISTDAFQKRVPEAIPLVAGYREYILRIGQMMFLRLGNANVSREARRSQLQRANGYYLDLGLMDKDFTGIVRIDFVAGYDVLVFASYDPVRNRVTTGYLVHERASAIGACIPDSAGMDTRTFADGAEQMQEIRLVDDIYLVDAVERFRKTPLRRFLWFNSEQRLVGGKEHHGWTEIRLVGPVLEPASKFNATSKNFLDETIWDVAAHGVVKP